MLYSVEIELNPETEETVKELAKLKGHISLDEAVQYIVENYTYGNIDEWLEEEIEYLHDIFDD